MPWLNRLRDLRRKEVAQEQIDQPTVRKPNAPHGHDLSDYAGSYHHPAYGQMTITHDADQLHWAWRIFSGALSHRHYETFDAPRLVYELNPDHLAISFLTDRDGNVSGLSAQLEPMTGDIVFARVASGECMDVAFREACVGRYRSGSITHEISLRANGQLTLKVDYQPLYKLSPYQGAVFSIVELEGFRVEFRRGPTKSADELVFHQPNGTFVVPRMEADDV